MRRKILVVDDQEIDRHLLSEVLSDEYEVIEAPGGKEALSFLKNAPVKVSAVILDIVMPEIDGFEVLAYMRSDELMSSIPVIVVSGNDDQYTEEKALTIGANDFLVKPFGPEIVKRRLWNTIHLSETIAKTDAEVMDVILFNKYIGSACIIEYRSEITRVLRVNRAYAYDIVGNEELADFALSIKLDEYMDGANRELFFNTIAHTIDSGSDSSCEVKLFNLPNKPGFTYLSITFKTIDSSGERSLIFASVKNNTLQRIAQKKESETAGKLQVIMNNINGGIVAASVDVDYVHIIFANEQYYSMFGYTKSQFSDEVNDPMILIHHDDRLRVTRVINEIVREEIPKEIEYRCIKRNGSIVYVRCSSSVIRLDGYYSPVMLSVVTDITESALNKHKMAELSDHLFAIMKNINGGVTATIFKDEIPNILFSNDQYYEMLGYSREWFEENKVNAFNLIHPEDKQRVVKITLDAFDNCKNFSVTYRVICSDCRIKWLQSSVSITHIEGINSPVQISVANDITLQVLAEQKEKELSTTLSAVLENMNDGLSVSTLKNRKMTYLIQNDKYCSMFGYTKEQFNTELKNGISDLIFSNDAASYYDAIELVEKTNTSTVIEYRARKRGGGFIWVRNSSSVCNIEGFDHPLHISVLTDITSEVNSIQKLHDLNNVIQEDKNTIESLMNNTPGGFMRLSISTSGDMSAIYINDGMAEMLGRKKEDIWESISNDIMTFVFYEDREPLVKELQRAIEKHRPINTSFRLINSDNKPIWFRFFGKQTEAIHDEYFFNMYFAEPSEVEKKDLTFKEMLPYVLEAIMRSSSDMSYLKDRDLNYISCNNHFVQFVGAKNEKEVIGKTVYDLFDKDYAEECWNSDLQILESGETSINIVKKLPTEDEVVHYSNQSKYILKDFSGEVIGIYGTIRDITEYKDNYSHLNLLANTISGGLVTYSYSNKTIKIIFYNDGFCNLFGYTRDEFDSLISEDPMFALYEEDKSGLMKVFEKTKNSAKAVNYVYRIKTKSDETIYLSSRSVVADTHKGNTLISTAVYDVTKQKLNEEANRIHEEEMRTAMTLLGKIICEYDIKTKCLTVPEKYATLYGIPLVMKNIPESENEYQFIVPKYKEAYSKFFERIAKGERRCIADVRTIWRNGYMRYEHYESFTLYNAKMKPVKAIISVEDTSDKIEMFKKFTHEQRLRRQLVSTSLIYYELNVTNGEIIEYISKSHDVPSMEEGIKTNELMKHEILANVHNDDREIVSNHLFTQALRKLYGQGKRDIVIDYRRKWMGPNYIWIRATITMLENPETKDTLAFIYVNDIDKEKKESLAIEKLIGEEIETIIVIDKKTKIAHGINNIKIDERLSKYVKDENVTKDVTEIRSVKDVVGNYFDYNKVVSSVMMKNVHPDDRNDYKNNMTLESLNKNLETDSNITFVYRFLVENEYRRMSTNAFYLDKSCSTIILSRRDVTKIYEEEQRQKQILKNAAAAAEKANKAKSEFISRISHDMRTPMNAIIGLVNLAEKSNDEKERNVYLKNINSASNVLLGLINNTLDLNKMENSEIKFKKEPFQLDEFKNKINTVIRPLADDKDINFVFQMGCGANCLLVDKTRFTQVFINLLSNAIKFTDRGGKIEFIAEHIPDKNDLYGMRFYVRDNGRGMSKKFQKIMFQPFSQENELEKNQGSGLGLSIVKNIIDSAGGTIKVNSALRKGTEFIIDLYEHIIKENEIEEEEEEKTYDCLSGIRVLFVEDNELNVMVGEKLLEMQGCKIDLAENGKDAIKMFSESTPWYYSAILMDVRMPVMGGIEATKKIRALNRFDAKEIPIIAMTADALADDEQRTYKAGMNDYISKPIDPKLLYEKLAAQITLLAITNKNKTDA